MAHHVFVVIYFAVMAAVIIGVDIAFLQHHFWWRLGTNVTVVVIFAAVYLLFLKNAFE